MSITTLALLFLSLAAAMAIALALAWVPMRMLMGKMARDLRLLIERQRERRKAPRDSPDRRRL